MNLEILMMLKHQRQAWMISCLICLALLIATNATWLCYYTSDNGKEVNECEQISSGENMRISGFTEPELEYLRNVCNFTPLEMQVFNLRAKNLSLESIAEILNYSAEYFKRISQRINRKIIRSI